MIALAFAAGAAAVASIVGALALMALLLRSASTVIVFSEPKVDEPRERRKEVDDD